MSQRDIIYVIIAKTFSKTSYNLKKQKEQITNISSNQEIKKKLTLNSDLSHYKNDETILKNLKNNQHHIIPSTRDTSQTYYFISIIWKSQRTKGVKKNNGKTICQKKKKNERKKALKPNCSAKEKKNHNNMKPTLYFLFPLP